MKRTLPLILATAALSITGTAAYAAHTDGGPWVTSVDGTQKAGFVKHFNTGETVTYQGIQHAIDDCWDLGGGETTQYCLGIVDARYPDLTELKRALEKAQ